MQRIPGRGMNKKKVVCHDCTRPLRSGRARAAVAMGVHDHVRRTYLEGRHHAVTDWQGRRRERVVRLKRRRGALCPHAIRDVDRLLLCLRWHTHVLHALRSIIIMRLWFALLPVALLTDPAEGRARKPAKARGNGANGRAEAPSDEQVELQFDGGSKLGLGFVKGSMPLTIRHVTPDTWAAHQSDLHPGVQLLSVGGSKLIGRSYTDAINLLRAGVGASSKQAQLSLTFALRNEPNSALQSTPAVGSEKTTRRLLAGCASLRERDLQSTARHLSAFLKANGHSMPNRDAADHRDALREALQSSAVDLRTRLVFALSLAVRQDLEVEAATIASSTAGAEWGDYQQTLQQRTVDMYNEVAESAAAAALLLQQTPNPQSTWPQHIELAALGRSSAYSWSMRQLGPAISAQRRMVNLVSNGSHKLLSATEQSDTHTQLGVLLITRGSVVHSKADHTEAVHELMRARELSPVDPYPQA